jgi:hypothetical protein
MDTIANLLTASLLMEPFSFNLHVLKNYWTGKSMLQHWRNGWVLANLKCWIACLILYQYPTLNTEFKIDFSDLIIPYWMPILGMGKKCVPQSMILTGSNMSGKGLGCGINGMGSVVCASVYLPCWFLCVCQILVR